MCCPITLAEIKRHIRQPYAWPGGYPLYFITADCEALSIDSAKDCWRQIVQAHLDAPHGYRDEQWLIVACEINWEDPALYCAHSGERIESAYAEDDAEG